MEISKKLRETRLKQKYSQDWVAKYLGYASGCVIYKKEHSYRSFSVSDIQKLCKLYRINPNELLSCDEKGSGEKDARKK